MAVSPRSRHSAADKGLLLAAVELAIKNGFTVRRALGLVGLEENRYYRWRSRSATGRPLSDQPPRGRPRKPAPTPAEEAVTVAHALEYPLLGYKRLAYLMANTAVAYPVNVN